MKKFYSRSNHHFKVIFFKVTHLGYAAAMNCHMPAFQLYWWGGVNILQWHCANLLCKPPVPHRVGLGAAGGAAKSFSCWWWTSHHLQEGVLVPGRTGEDRWAVFLGGKVHSLSHLDPSWEGSRSFARRGASQHHLVAAMDDSGGMLLNGFEMPFTGFACFWQKVHKQI